MLYRIKLVSDEVNSFFRVIDIDSEATFADLRKIILDSVGYSHDAIDSFCTCTDEWEPVDEVVIEDMGIQSSDRDLYLMDTTLLSELIEDEGQKMVFIFDNLNERAFFMEVKELLPGKHLDSPSCISKQGKAPAQELIVTPEVEVKSSTSDLFSDFGADDDNEGYDDEDFDSLEEKDSLDF